MDVMFSTQMHDTGIADEIRKLLGTDASSVGGRDTLLFPERCIGKVISHLCNDNGRQVLIESWENGFGHMRLHMTLLDKSMVDAQGCEIYDREDVEYAEV